MSGVALGIGVTSAAVGMGASYLGSRKAAGASRDAMNAQLAEEQRALEMYQQAVKKAAPMYDPYMKAGGQAFGTMADLMRPGGYLYNAPDMTDFRADPQYQNIKNQALESIRGSHAAAGGLYSGQTDIDLMQKASELADQAYGQIYQRKTGEQNTLASRLGGMSDYGKWATGSLSDLYTGNARDTAGVYGRMGETLGTGIRGVGDAKASGIMGIGNSITQGIGMGMNVYGANQNRQSYDALMARLAPPQNTSNFNPTPFTPSPSPTPFAGDGPLMSYGNW